MHLNANCNVGHIAEYLFADIPTMTKTRKCANCNYNNVRNISVLPVLLQNGFSDIENAILDANHEEQLTCKMCQQIVTENHIFHSHLLIDCSIFDQKYATFLGKKKNIETINNIPKVLKLYNQEYI